MKVILLVIMPLLTTGFLTALLARVGLRMPPAIERLLGVAARASSAGGGLGLVGEAVRMVSGGSGGAGGAAARVAKAGSSGGFMMSGARDGGGWYV